MIRHIWIRFQRKPLVSLAVVLFTAIITMVLCGLYNGNETAKVHYEEVVSQIDIRCTLTNLAGDQSDGLYISAGDIQIFTDGGIAKGLSKLLEDVQIKGSKSATWEGENYTLCGITSTEIDSKLWPDNGCTIFWNGNFGEDIFKGSEDFCIIPEALAKALREREMPEDSVSLHINGQLDKADFDGAFSVAGIYSGKNDKIIYCPWKTYVQIVRGMGEFEKADSLYATLRDNRDLSRLRETAKEYFATPDSNAAGLETADGYWLALDINDSQLEQAKLNLDHSMALNRVAAVLMFGMSAMAGGLVGFLMIRSRNREIMLMRTMGTPSIGIYFSFAVEQVICAVLGAVVGGSKFLWKPASWLVLFIGVYFIGLSAALLFFLHQNLLTTIKEDE